MLPAYFAFAEYPDMKSVTILNPNFDFGKSLLDIIAYNSCNQISAESFYNGMIRVYKESMTAAYAKKYDMSFEITNLLGYTNGFELTSDIEYVILLTS